MGYIKIQVSDEVEKRFRHAAMSRFGYTKGSLSLAAERAFSEWAGSDEEMVHEVRKIIRKVRVKDVASEIRGLLSHVKGKTSTELKHEIGGIRAKRTMHYAHRH